MIRPETDCRPRPLPKRVHRVIVPSMCSLACHYKDVSLPRMP